MKKWLILVVLTAFVILLSRISPIASWIHPAFYVMVTFFTVQTFVLFRIGDFVSEKWRLQVGLINISIRFLSSAFFILIVLDKYESPRQLVLQFGILYLLYLTFEIGVSLTNLRRN